MKHFKPNKFALALALVGLPGLAAAANYDLTAAQTYPASLKKPFVGGKGSKMAVRGTETTPTNNNIQAVIVFLDGTNSYVGQSVTATDDNITTGLNISLTVPTIPAGAAKAIVVLDAGAGNTLDGVSRYAYVNNDNNTAPGFSGNAAWANITTDVIPAAVAGSGVLPIHPDYLAINITKAQANAVLTPQNQNKVFVTFNADPIDVSSVLGNYYAAGANLKPIVKLSNTGALGNEPATVVRLNDSLSAKAIPSQLFMGVDQDATGNFGVNAQFIAVKNGGTGLDDGAGNKLIDVNTIPMGLINGPAYAPTGKKAVATVATHNENIDGFYTPQGLSDKVLEIGIRMDQGIDPASVDMVSDSVNLANNDILVEAGGINLNNITILGEPDPAHKPLVLGADLEYSIITLVVSAPAPAGLRVNPATGNIEYSANNTVLDPVWTPVTTRLQVVPGSEVTASWDPAAKLTAGSTALTAANVVTDFAQSPVIKTAHFTSLGNLVDGAKIDFRQSVGAANAADFSFKTKSNSTGAQNGATITFTTQKDPLAPNIIGLQMTDPTGVAWLASGDSAAYYNKAHFNSGISGLSVPFEVQLAGPPATNYDHVYIFQTGLPAPIGLGDLSIGDGVAPILTDASFGIIGNESTLLLTFSENLWASNGPREVDYYRLDNYIPNNRQPLQKALEYISFGGSFPGTPLAPANFNVLGNATGDVTGSTITLKTTTKFQDLAGQKIFIDPRISTGLDNKTQDTVENGFIIGDDGNFLQEKTGVTVVRNIKPEFKGNALAMLSYNSAPTVSKVVINLTQPVRKRDVDTKLDDYFRVVVGNCYDGQTMVSCNANHNQYADFTPEFSTYLSDAEVALSPDGKQITLSLPNALVRKNFGGMEVYFGPVDQQVNLLSIQPNDPVFGDGKSPLVLTTDVSRQLQANHLAVDLPDLASGISRLFSEDIGGSIAGLPKDSQYSVYLAAMAPRDGGTSRISVNRGSLSGPSAELQGVALGLDKSVNGRQGGGNPSDAVNNQSGGHTPSLSEQLTTQAKNQDNTPIPVWVKVSRTNNAAPGSALLQESGVNRIGASATLYGNAKEAGIDNGDTQASPATVYEASLDPATGNITGGVTGKLVLDTKVSGVDVATLMCVRKSVDIDPLTGQTTKPLVSCDDPDAATIKALAGEGGQIRFTISTDRSEPYNKTIDAFLLIAVKTPRADGTEHHTLVTSADPHLSNYLPFIPDLSRTSGPTNSASTQLMVSASNLANIRTVPLAESTDWQLLGVGNVDLAYGATTIDPTRAFVTVDERGVPQTLWQGDGADHDSARNGVGMAADWALTLAGNVMGSAFQTAGQAERSQVPGKSGVILETNNISSANTVRQGFALGFMNDSVYDGASEVFFPIKAPAPATLPAGWSLVTIQQDISPAALPVTIEAVIKTGASPEGSEADYPTATWFRGESQNTLSTIKNGQAVFIFSNGATPNFTFGVGAP